MVNAFPIWALSLVLCPRDRGALVPDETAPLVDGMVSCMSCGSGYAVRGGILDLLDAAFLTSQSRLELDLRENEWAEKASVTRLTDFDRAEIDPHVEALALQAEFTVIEFGCGSGRYTRELQALVKRLVAVDFSLQALQSLSRFAGDNVALVRADVDHLHLVSGRFDRALSTLTSNLPTRTARETLFRMSAMCLRPTGRFIFGCHYYGLRARLTRVTKSGAYHEGGIYRYYMTTADVLDEVSPWFQHVQVRPVRIVLPFGRTLGLPLLVMSRVSERLPLIRQFGDLLMGMAAGPRVDKAA